MKESRSLFFVCLLARSLCACEDPGAGSSRAVPARDATIRSTTPSASLARATNAPQPDAQPVLIAGKPTGYFSLPNGLLVRRKVQACPSQLPTRGCLNKNKKAQSCGVDSECTQGKNGYCHRRGLAPSCNCDYGCLTDSECGSGEICICSNPVGRCVKAHCDEKTACERGTCSTFLKGNRYVDMTCREAAEPAEKTD
jgi:hypothetical protein